MLKSVDFKALSIGLLIYIVTTAAAVFLFIAGLNAAQFHITPIWEYVFELCINMLAIFCAGYYTFKLTRPGLRDHSLLLGIIVFSFLAMGTIAQLFDSEGNPFLLNITYDASSLLLAYLGGRMARRRGLRQSEAGNITG